MLRMALFALWAVCVLPAHSQEGLVSPILTLDQERLFADARLAAIVSDEIEQRRRELAEENRRIEAELEAEELSLTEQRPTLEAEEFRGLADAFTEKVSALRAQQEAKFVELQLLEDSTKQEFIGRIVAAIARERGAVMVIDRRNVILSAGAIDITEEAIIRGVQALEGTQEAPEEDSPVQDR